MNHTSLAALLAHPPVRTTILELDDGSACQIHELPIAVIDRIRSISKDDSGDDMANVIYVATWSLAGRKPTDTELTTVRERFGTGSVLKIYKEALTFSQLSDDAIEQEKKH